MRRAFGDLWLTRVELAYMFVAVAAVLIAVAGAALTLLPLLAVVEIRRTSGKSAVAAYFLTLGLAYMAIEMTAMSWLTRIIGEPVTAAAVTITTFLLASGAGSLLSQRIEQRPHRAVTLAVIGIVIWAIVLAALNQSVLSWIAALPCPAGCWAAPSPSRRWLWPWDAHAACSGAARPPRTSVDSLGVGR